MNMKVADFVRATRIDSPPPDGAWSLLRGNLDQRRSSRTRRRILTPVFALASAAAVAVVWFARPPHPTEIGSGGAFESAANEVSLALPDGVQANLGPHSQVSVNQVTGTEIRVGLGHGRARFDVEQRRQRRFVVDVDGIEVRVIGTRFEVARIAAAGGDARVEVAVERGIVEVRNRRGDGEPHRLHAGDRFSALISPAPDRPAGARDDGDAEAEDETEAAIDDATTSAGPPRRGAVRSRATATPVEEARVLLERAQRQWRAGRMADAAAVYEEILARFPSDPRAGLAALELGRIRMDDLGDLKGAVASLERAVRSAPGASFHEDALARLAQADARLGRRAECLRARDAYRTRYPNGIHTAVVERACDAHGRDQRHQERGDERDGRGGRRNVGTERRLGP